MPWSADAAGFLPICVELGRSSLKPVAQRERRHIGTSPRSQEILLKPCEKFSFQTFSYLPFGHFWSKVECETWMYVCRIRFLVINDPNALTCVSQTRRWIGSGQEAILKKVFRMVGLPRRELRAAVAARLVDGHPLAAGSASRGCREIDKYTKMNQIGNFVSLCSGFLHRHHLTNR